MYSLTISHHNKPVDEYIMRQEVATVGRGGENDIQLIDTTVSQKHARFVVSPEGLVIEDMRSTNGTYVNGQRVTRQHLVKGDQVMIGQHKLSFDDLNPSEENYEQEPTLQMSRNSIEQMLIDSQTRPASPPPADTKAINWVAQDQNGVWWGFEQQPVAESSGWSNFQDTMKLKLKQESPNPGWRETLHKV